MAAHGDEVHSTTAQPAACTQQPAYNHNSSGQSAEAVLPRLHTLHADADALTCSSLASRSFSSARTMWLLRASAWVTRSSSSSLVLPSDSVCTARQGMICQQALPVP